MVLINKKLKYPLAVAEKDYFLAIVSKIIYESPLRNKLIFKGGTALYHTYLPQLRFSEDLDFSSNKNPMGIVVCIKVKDMKKFYATNQVTKPKNIVKINS
mgnify:CR=1 FL=1